MNIIKVYKQFPTNEDCLEHLESIRWKDGEPQCPYCVSKRTTPLKGEKRYHCNACNTSFSVTVGTIFHKTKVDLQKWFLAISLVLNAKKGISSRQLARDIDVNKNTAWYMLMRIRKAMIEHGDLLEGIVEADETYVGGKNKNRHNDKKTKGGQGRNTKDKVPVIGVMQRGGKVRAKKSKNVTSRTLKSFIGENVKKGSNLMTDEWVSYKGLDKYYQHQIVSHGKGEYVSGNAHTNSIENFWSIFKRGIVGQYHKISVKHINSYLHEFCFPFNHRNTDNMFDIVLLQALGVS